MEVTVYSTTTGEIVSRHARPDVFDVLPLLGPYQDFLPGWYDLQLQRVDVATKQVIDLPPSPGDWAVFDYDHNVWVDPRDPAVELSGQRKSASMSRSDFLLAAISAGIILPSDAGPAARGEIPPSLVSVFDSLPPEVRIEAVVRWGAATAIERTNPVLAALAEAMAITDAELDALFGINLATE